MNHIKDLNSRVESEIEGKMIIGLFLGLVVANNTRSLLGALMTGEGVRTTSNTGIPPLDLVKSYPWFTAATYCTNEELRNWDCYSCKSMGYRVRFVSGFDNEKMGTRGYVALDDTNKRIILTFRATENDKNTFQNYNLIQTAFKGVGSPPVRVSRGPLAAMESLEPQFLAVLKPMLEDPRLINYKLAVLGHSSGSTMASLAAARIKTNLNIPGNRMEVYVYGMPRVGNRIFAEWYNNQGMAVARVVNKNDIFPHAVTVPGNYYVHHQNELWVRGPPNNYTITECDSSVLEDANCSKSVPVSERKKAPHTKMFDVDYLDELCEN